MLGGGAAGGRLLARSSGNLSRSCRVQRRSEVAGNRRHDRVNAVLPPCSVVELGSSGRTFATGSADPTALCSLLTPVPGPPRPPLPVLQRH